MPKIYTVQEKENIRKALRREAGKCLALYGVRKTTVDELIRRVDIPKGTFYLFYDSKEALFFDILTSFADEVENEYLAMLQEIDENHMKTVCDNGETYDLERIEEERKKSDKLNEFVRCLSPRQQQIIHLYYIEQRKYDDICRIMGINYQSVRNLMHRSLLKLRFLAAKTGAL